MSFFWFCRKILNRCRLSSVCRHWQYREIFRHRFMTPLQLKNVHGWMASCQQSLTFPDVNHWFHGVILSWYHDAVPVWIPAFKNHCFEEGTEGRWFFYNMNSPLFHNLTQQRRSSVNASEHIIIDCPLCQVPMKLEPVSSDRQQSSHADSFLLCPQCGKGLNETWNAMMSCRTLEDVNTAYTWFQSLFTGFITCRLFRERQPGNVRLLRWWCTDEHTQSGWQPESC